MFEPNLQTEPHHHNPLRKKTITTTTKSNLKRNSNKENYYFQNESSSQAQYKAEHSFSSSSTANQLSQRDSHQSKFMNNRKTENFYLAYKETKRDHSKKTKKLSELKTNVPLWRREDDSIIIKRIDKMEVPKEKRHEEASKNIPIKEKNNKTSPSKILNVHRSDRFKGTILKIFFPSSSSKK